jgi:ABC-type sugar transport system substrate-binding protein
MRIPFRRTGFAAVLLPALAVPVAAQAEIPGNTLKIGILNDQSGPFADQSGKGSVAAAELAVATIRTSPTSARTSCANGSTRTASRPSPMPSIPASVSPSTRS